MPDVTLCGGIIRLGGSITLEIMELVVCYQCGINMPSVMKGILWEMGI